VITEIHLFDFDGTLFNSPEDTPENQEKFEQKTGMPWLIDKKKAKELSEKLGHTVHTRSGWWGRKETLEPPLVPDPAPIEWFNKKVLFDLNSSKLNEAAITLLLTGRLIPIKPCIERICSVANIIDDHVWFYVMGENGPDPLGPKPTSTFSWKVWIVEQFLRLNPNINQLIVWEDREDHVKKFQELSSTIKKEIIVNHIKKID
jgi:hypothetical protein